MTSYQGRLRETERLNGVLNSISTVVLTLSVIFFAIAYVGAKTRADKAQDALGVCSIALNEDGK